MTWGVANKRMMFLNGTPVGERTIVHTGGQSMPLGHNNANPPYHSEGERTWDTAQDWTVEGVDTVLIHVRGKSTNPSDTLYVALKNGGKKVGVVANPDPDLVKTRVWTERRIPLADFGVNPAKIKTLYLGVGDRDDPQPGGTGLVYIDDIRLVKAATPVEPNGAVTP